MPLIMSQRVIRWDIAAKASIRAGRDANQFAAMSTLHDMPRLISSLLMRIRRSKADAAFSLTSIGGRLLTAIERHQAYPAMRINQ